MTAGPRRRGRECALQILYDLDGAPPHEVEARLALFWSELGAPSEESPGESDPEARRFADALVRGTRARLGEIDPILQRCSERWRLERMSRVDRNLLRLAAYELAFAPDVPASVILDEAIEIAKRFGAAESSAFVNGVLDRAARELRPHEVR